MIGLWQWLFEYGDGFEYFVLDIDVYFFRKISGWDQVQFVGFWVDFDSFVVFGYSN